MLCFVVILSLEKEVISSRGLAFGAPGLNRGGGYALSQASIFIAKAMTLA